MTKPCVVPGRILLACHLRRHFEMFSITSVDTVRLTLGVETLRTYPDCPVIAHFDSYVLRRDMSHRSSPASMATARQMMAVAQMDVGSQARNQSTSLPTPE